MQQQELGHVNAPAWSTIVVILSLDLAAPYIDRMGLMMPPDYQGELRRLIEPELATNNGPELPLVIILDFMSWLSETYETSYSNNLIAWANHVFDDEEIEAKIFLWSMLAVRDKSQSEISSTPQFLLALREELSRYPDEYLHRLTPTSDWDKRIYVHQEYDDLISAMEWVQATINRYTFRRSWSTVRDRYPALYDIAAIKTWGTQTAVLKKMPVARLGDPGSWPDLPKLL